MLATNDDTATLARRLGARRVQMMSDTAVDVYVHASADPFTGPYALFPGRSLITKRTSLCCCPCQWRGHTDVTRLQVTASFGSARRLIGESALGEHVRLHGHIPREQVLTLLRAADVMLFTSMRESFGGQLVEAAAAALPIVTLDLHGASAMLPSEAATKIPSPPQPKPRIESLMRWKPF